MSKTIGGVIGVQPRVPGFVIAGELGSSATGCSWAAVRSLDDHPFVLKVIPVAEAIEAQVRAARQIAVLSRIQNEHLVRLQGAIALADGTLALVQDEVAGGSLARLLGARGQLTPGETVTILAPLFEALADLHAAGLVHGDLEPGNVVFSANGRPLINDLVVAHLLGRRIGPTNAPPGFVAPELLGGATPSPASDIYSLAALGWFCLTGVPPGPVAIHPSLTMLGPETPAALGEVLAACLSMDPAGRPAADAAAIEVFEAAPAEPVALASMSDPAAEITRRIRVAAVSASALARPPARKGYRNPRAMGFAVLLAMALGGGTTWFLSRPSENVPTKAVASAAQPMTTPTMTTPTMLATSLTPMTRTATPTPPRATSTPTAPPQSAADVVTAPASPRKATTRLLQGLVDGRALAYVARESALLDLVYAPGAPKAGVDRANIATALQNGATYLGLSFAVKDAAFLDGTSDTARIRATILTPPYETGQPDGRKVAHAEEIVGPSVFSLSLTRDGWRIMSLTGP